MAPTERLLFAEFTPDGRLWQVETTSENYDVEYCRQDNYYMSRSGGSAGLHVGDLVSGKTVRWWAASEEYAAKVERGANERRLKRLPRGWSQGKVLDIVRYCEIGDIARCYECNDSFCGDGVDRPCEHVWWCHFEDCNQWTGPGSDDPCPHGSYGFELLSTGGWLNRYKELPWNHRPPRSGPSYSGKAS